MLSQTDKIILFFKWSSSTLDFLSRADEYEPINDDRVGGVIDRAFDDLQSQEAQARYEAEHQELQGGVLFEQPFTDEYLPVIDEEPIAPGPPPHVQKTGTQSNG
ncbi:MAG: hypothetical protein GY906_24210 [bacterium]|nr:hypothetical protein [bacterium]